MKNLEELKKENQVIYYLIKPLIEDELELEKYIARFETAQPEAKKIGIDLLKVFIPAQATGEVISLLTNAILNGDNEVVKYLLSKDSIVIKEYDRILAIGKIRAKNSFDINDVFVKLFSAANKQDKRYIQTAVSTGRFTELQYFLLNNFLYDENSLKFSESHITDIIHAFNFVKKPIPEFLRKDIKFVSYCCREESVLQRRYNLKTLLDSGFAYDKDCFKDIKIEKNNSSEHLLDFFKEKNLPVSHKFLQEYKDVWDNYIAEDNRSNYVIIGTIAYISAGVGIIIGGIIAASILPISGMMAAELIFGIPLGLTVFSVIATAIAVAAINTYGDNGKKKQEVAKYVSEFKVFGKDGIAENAAIDTLTGKEFVLMSQEVKIEERLQTLPQKQENADNRPKSGVSNVESTQNLSGETQKVEVKVNQV